MESYDSMGGTLNEPTETCSIVQKGHKIKPKQLMETTTFFHLKVAIIHSNLHEIKYQPSLLRFVQTLEGVNGPYPGALPFFQNVFLDVSQTQIAKSPQRSIVQKLDSVRQQSVQHCQMMLTQNLFLKIILGENFFLNFMIFLWFWYRKVLMVGSVVLVDD